MMEKKRLKGLVIFGVLVLLYGFLGSVGCFQTILKEGINIYHLIGLFFSIVFLVSGIGILTLKEWARILFLWAFIPALTFDFFVAIFIEMPKYVQKMGLEVFSNQMMRNQIFPILGVLFIMWLIIKYHLSHPKIREQFIAGYECKEDKKRFAKYVGLILLIVALLGVTMTVKFFQKWNSHSGPSIYRQNPGYFSPDILASINTSEIKKISWLHNNKTIELHSMHYRELLGKISELKPTSKVGMRGEKWIPKGALYIYKSASDPMIIAFETRNSISPNILAQFKRDTGSSRIYYGYYIANKLYNWIASEAESKWEKQ